MYYTVRYCAVLYCTGLYCTVLCCTVMYYCTVRIVRYVRYVRPLCWTCNDKLQPELGFKPPTMLICAHMCAEAALHGRLRFIRMCTPVRGICALMCAAGCFFPKYVHRQVHMCVATCVHCLRYVHVSRAPAQPVLGAVEMPGSLLRLGKAIGTPAATNKTGAHNSGRVMRTFPQQKKRT